MLLDVTLCKTPINTTDTLYFANANNQKAYFNGITEKTVYESASFNGARSFRINVNYLEAINTKYNYMYYEYDNRTWYCFIDTYEYINDNITAVNVTLDFIQTFMFDITWKSSRVASLTWKDSHFENGYIPYSNKFPSADKVFTALQKLTSKAKLRTADNSWDLMWLHVTVDANVNFKAGYSIEAALAVNATEEIIASQERTIVDEWKTVRNNITLPFYTFIFPLLANTGEPLDIDFNRPEFTRTWKESYGFISKFIADHSVNIIDVSLVAGNYGDYIIEFQSATNLNRIFESDTVNQGRYSTDGLTKAVISYLKGNSDAAREQACYVAFLTKTSDATSPIGGVLNKQYSLELSDIAINREPYKSIVIGSSLSNEEIELNDVIIEKRDDGKHYLNYCVEYEIIPPFLTTVTIGKANTVNDKIESVETYDKTLRFTLDLSRPVPYEVTAWAEYYSTNSASVNDGLKTKHGYEKEIAKRELTNSSVQGGLGVGIGLASSLIGVLGKKPSPQLVLGGGGQMISGVSQIIDGRIQYDNAMTNMQKEKALLELSWNDIKSAPSEANNALISTISILAFDNVYATVYLCEAINIDDIKKYHKMYGYQTEEVVSADELQQYHTVFDYIRFEDANFITNLPHNTHQIIKDIFESGVRFWYDIDTFLNFDIDNPEYQGV